MGSSRLRGKTLAPLAGRPVLGHVLDRLRRCRHIDQIVVATSDAATDGAIHDFCQRDEVARVRGDPHNVARRVLDAVEQFDLAAFVHVRGNSPLIDPELIDTAIELFMTGRYDLVTNNIERTFPVGQTVEVLCGLMYRDGFLGMHTAEHFERVTPYFHEHADDYRVFNFTAQDDYSDVRLVVDTENDLREMNELLARLDPPHCSHGLRKILEQRGRLV
jgi:spore coat polysaccharide biosynthesis protein SpsF